MKTNDLQNQEVITLRPATLFAFLKISGWLIASCCLLCLSWWIWPGLMSLSLAIILFACYQFCCIRRFRYIITPEAVKVQNGIFLKTVRIVELFRIKDYVITRPLSLQCLKLMNLKLNTTDAKCPVIHLQGIPYSDIIETLRERVLESRRRYDGIIIN